MFVKHRFILDRNVIDELKSMQPNFGYNGFGEFLYYRTYSRAICYKHRTGLKYDRLKGVKHYCGLCESETFPANENWADTVIRVTQGVFSIRKDWYLRNYIPWDEDFWQHYARGFALALFAMKWLPPGRGLWAMGTDYVYNRGSMALNNCGLTVINAEDWSKDIHWMMDALMNGVGVGFNPERNDGMVVHTPHGTYDYVIEDTREDWCDSTKCLMDAYLYPGKAKPRLIYDNIRPAGEPIHGFGGIASGPEPLMKFHQKIEKYMDMYGCEKWYDSYLLKTDIANETGVCVVAGNVRRSAELLGGEIDDIIDLKNYEKYPYRESHGWMSNNSALLKSDRDFERLGEIAERIKLNGEPGFINLRNLPYGRIGKDMDGLAYDKAIGFNPCGEQPLEDKELCTLAETCPTRCENEEDWYKAAEYATIYGTTVTLLPTHRPETNAVMLRNRRIGVGIVDVAGWKEQIGTTRLIKYLRAGYNRVRSTAAWGNREAGVPLPIRHTTVKPGGTTPKLPGLRSGWFYPTHGLTLRRVRVAHNSPVYPILVEAGVPHEPLLFSTDTDCFEFVIDQSDNGRVRTATEVSIWEQAMMLMLLQREWSDNAVSNTIYYRPKWGLVEDIDLGESFYSDAIKEEYRSLFERTLGIDYESFIIDQEAERNGYKAELVTDKWSDSFRLKIYKYDDNHEEDYVEPVLAMLAPVSKSVSVLPHSSKGVYRQIPEEGITSDEYNRRLFEMRQIDWSKLSGSDGQDERYCQGENCEIPRR